MKRRTFLESAGAALALMTLPGEKASALKFAVPKSSARHSSSELRFHNGRQVLFINGQPHDGIFCSVSSRCMKNFIDAGFDIFDARDIPHGWVDDGKYDFRATDKTIRSFLKQKPDAKLIVRCGWFPRNFWWVLKHPEEAAVPHARNKKLLMPSYASLRWREESSNALSRFVAHVEEEYGESVVAYLPDAGEPGEWFERYAYCEDADRFTAGYEMGDYSPAMQRAYRQYAQAKYGNIAELNRVYRITAADCSEIRIPETDRRLSPQIGNLRSLEKEQAVIDFYEVLNRQVLETLLQYAQKTKEGCHRNKLVFAFYGYHWLEQPRGGVSQARSGHVHLDEVLSCADIDALVAPYHYDFRQTEGVMSSQCVVGSVLRRGKQFIHECDGSTYLKSCWPCPDHNNPANPQESGKLLKRDLSRALMDGSFVWFMDLSGGMYDSPEMVTEMKNTLQIGRRLFWETGYSDRQVAVVLHSRDAFYQREGEPLRAALIPQFKQHELECAGLGYDDLMLENLKYLKPAETEQYKVWIFPAAVRLEDEEIGLIQEHCCRNGNFVFWMYAPGAVGNAGIDLERIKKISGFELACTLEPGELAIEVIPTDHPLTQGRKSPIVYGTYGELGPDLIRYHSSLRHYPGTDVGFRITPRFYIQEADVYLGRVLDIPGQPAGLGVRHMRNWTSVLSTAPLVPKHILRNVAEAAGCHVFTDFPGQTYHSRDYLGFFAHESGDCRFRFPIACKVVDVFQGTTIGEGVREISIPVRINDALLLHYVGTGV